MIRTLLAALMLTVFSSVSYGGSLDGKGLICGNEAGYWFSNDKVHIHKITGHTISVESSRYMEIGTKSVQWTDYVTPIYMNRENLKISVHGKDYQCNIVQSENEITNKLNTLIEAGKKKSKI